MAVVLPDRALTVTVFTHPQVRDARGKPMPSDSDGSVVRGPYPGSAEHAGGNVWNLCLDPRCWPIRTGDLVSDGANTWVVAPEPLLKQIPGHSDIDFVRASATLDPPQTP